MLGVVLLAAEGCGLAFTDAELALMRLAIVGGVVGASVLGLAFVVKVVRGWLWWLE